MADEPFSLFYLPFRPALDANGIVVPGASLTFYLSGTNTLQAVYADAGLTTPLANPLTANAAGKWPAIYIDRSLTYRVVLRGQIGETLESVDPYIPGMIGGPAGDPGPADNTYNSYAAMQASDPTRASARLVGDTDTPAHPDGPYNNPSQTLGGWVPQLADGIRYVGAIAQAVPRTVRATLDEFAISPEMVGAVGDGVTDDTAALRRAVTSGRSVRLTQGKTYLLSSRLDISASRIAIGGGGTIKIASTWDFASDAGGPGLFSMRAIFVTGDYVTFDGLIFDLSEAPEGTAVENGMIWSTAAFTSVTSCQFIGNPKGTCIWGLGPFLNVQGCTFNECSGAAFARGRGPIISNNIIRNAFDAAIAINAPPCIGAVIVGNMITNESGRLIPAMIAVEEGASDWVIANNTMIGANGGGVWCGNVLLNQATNGGVITGNLIRANLADGSRPVSANPATMIYVSEYYYNNIVTGNKVEGVPSGNSNSCMVLVAATNTVVSDNTFNGIEATGIIALVRISAGPEGITVRDNKSRVPGGVRHYLFGPGNYANKPAAFVGGDFMGGAEGINAELSVASMTNFLLHIRDISSVNNVGAVINAPTAIGDRGAFLNAGAWERPHRISSRTEMYGTGIPANAGAMPFAAGDRIHILEPEYNDSTGEGSALGYVRVPGGTPWVPMGYAG